MLVHAFTRTKRFLWQSIVLALVTAMLVSGGFLASNRVSADVSLGGATNCDGNAVVYCGAGSASQLVAKYNGGDGRNSAASIQSIFSYFGITSAEVQAMPTSAVAGSVTKGGDVYVGSQLVATGALTGGRENMAGSTPASAGGTTFYTRPPSVSFLDNSLSAYVVMSNGQFQFAILSSCGNPIKATPTAPPPTPKPAPATPTGTCTNLSLTQAATDPRQVSATVTYQVTNGAALGGVTFDWGDGNTTAAGTQTTATHTYQEDGSHTVVATLVFSGTGSIPNATCQAPINTTVAMPVCGELDIQQNNDTVTVTNFSVANNGPATFDHAVIDWGDGSQTPSSTLSGVTNQTHTYASISATSPPTITATAYYTLNGQTIPVTGSMCQKAVVAPQAPPPTTPPPATTSSAPAPVLVNTGPGSVAALFGLTSVAGFFGYRWLLTRKLGR